MAHRLSTIREADLIIFLHRGRVLEQGTHEELMERRGLYYRMNLLREQEADTGGRE
ncbi:MAG: hypothetical protein JRF59_03295 [Deltaproteobacteria bacterium]|nr:hypothetical protein [Deltaproteobacteria bacterium]MBW1922663.1 hypothetical protein [Deltaproteobacteria bacterium]MBW1948734.1 hypothetical protein [Deltaproteobacteria bacterium]MBW2007634.1 hypothetical protein [Deltaproteobacteria bacterium]MBW2102660.1 hypothetical protein [Deltaproteobacteria bacterium]